MTMASYAYMPIFNACRACPAETIGTHRDTHKICPGVYNKLCMTSWDKSLCIEFVMEFEGVY
jgi:hypothetical protein